MAVTIGKVCIEVKSCSFVKFLEGRCVDENVVVKFREQKGRMIAVYNVLNFNQLVFNSHLWLKVFRQELG